VTKAGTQKMTEARMLPRSLLLSLALALALAVVVAGCASSGAGPSGSVVLYNGQHPQLTDALVTAFEKQTGIKVSVRTNDGVVLADQILQEGSASPADVYLTENSPELVTLDQHGLLAKLSATTLRQVPRNDAPPSGDWVPVALRISALAYDPGQISKAVLPVSILDLAQPSWKGKIAIAPTDSDFPPLVGAVLASYGSRAAADWLAGLKRNAQIFQTDEAVVAAVNRGEVATGVINQYYWYRLRAELGTGGIHSSLHYFPHHNVGSIENISGAAVLRSSQHRQRAEEFVKFLVSHTGQKILSRSYDFEYPARPGVAPNPQLPPISSLSPARLGAVKLGNDQAAVQLIQRAGLA
jgi:iron(III) transport system substrate-binding protein